MYTVYLSVVQYNLEFIRFSSLSSTQMSYSRVNNIWLLFRCLTRNRTVPVAFYFLANYVGIHRTIYPVMLETDSRFFLQGRI